jgi:hypothetical protein
MADRSVELLLNRDLHERITTAAAQLVRTQFCTGVVVPMYEAFYREVLERS